MQAKRNGNPATETQKYETCCKAERRAVEQSSKVSPVDGSNEKNTWWKTNLRKMIKDSVQYTGKIWVQQNAKKKKKRLHFTPQGRGTAKHKVKGVEETLVRWFSFGVKCIPLPSNFGIQPDRTKSCILG